MITSRAALEPVLAAHDAGRTVVLLLDFDGTLSPIADHPRSSHLADDRRALLRRLAAIPRVRVGVVSGRALAQLTALVDAPGLYYAGTGGMEIDLLGRALRHPAEQDAEVLIGSVADALQPLEGDWPGAWIERKPVGLTVHFRQLAVGDRTLFLDAVNAAVDGWRPYLLAIGGPLSLELLPRNGWTKGSAVEIIVADVGAENVLIVYAGDQGNDLHAFDVTNRLGGIVLAVGADAPPGASHTFANPDELGEYLTELAESLEAAT